ncbi:MAG: hypothetical protein AUK28_05175 [Desulfobacterales bacterium CG2_30_60_27]|nr:MAG: hypothetical protein AUK28_05175 [Desulfobacterales bacterium CG2_30_60_27]
MSTELDQYVGMREFARVDGHIYLDVRQITPEERPDIQSRISAQAFLPLMHALPDHEDKVLSDWLNQLNTKLDTILNLLTYEKDGIHALPFVKTNISGGGMSFASTRPYAEGDILELKMLLPMQPPVAMITYGEVTTVEKTDDSFTIGLIFTAIDEELRDEIIRFVFKTQRDMLREKHK